MKYIHTILSFLLFSASVSAQFTVTKVSGRVKTEAGGLIRPGSELKSSEHLYFSSMRDKLWVIQVGKGERMISPSPQATVENNVISQMLISAIHMDYRSGSLSGRGQVIEKLPDALQSDVGGTHKILIEDKNKYLFDLSQYPQTEGRTFFLQIDVPGEAPIVRPLRADADTLIILYTDFLTETNDPATGYKLGYFNPSANLLSSQISVIHPYFDLTSEMESVVANTILAYTKENKPSDSIMDKAYQNVYFTLGKPDYFLFTDLFSRIWQSRSASMEDLPGRSKGAVFNEQEFESVPKLTSSASVSRAELPSNFSLRQYAPPVGDQGQYGSCTAWATAYATRTITYAVHHNYSIHHNYDKIISYTFSPDFIYNNIRLSGDCNHGTSIYAALQFMKNKGNLVKTDKDFVCGRTYASDVLVNAKNYLIKDFSAVNTLRSDNRKLIDKLKALLVSKNALAFAMHLPNSFEHIDKSGIWYPTSAEYANVDSVRKGRAAYDGHAMCMIGYNDSIAGGAFEIMNSWGVRFGNNGFYWINYDDFLAFVFDIYTMNDFEPAAEDVVVPKIDQPHVVVPVVVPKVDIPKVVVVPKTDEKPRLKGNIEFMVLKPDGSYENTPVAKKVIGDRGQDVSKDSDDPTAYANFALAKPFYSGTRYKIRFNTSQPSYVYVFGMDNLRTYNLFPQKKYNESALINLSNSTLYLPNDSSHYKLDNVPGKEKMCVLLSKSPIDIDVLNQQFSANGHNLYQAVRNYLSKRLLEIKSINYSNNKIEFDSKVNDDDVLAFFIEMDHL